MTDIQHLLKIQSSPETIYNSLTTAAGIRNWWTDNADLDEYPGGKGVFRFHYNQTVETVVRITKLERPVLVEWIVETSFRPEQNGTLITFHLKPEANGVWLHFSQTGYLEADDTYALMNTGWAYYLVSLKQYVEKGQGKPSPNVDFGILLS